LGLNFSAHTFLNGRSTSTLNGVQEGKLKGLFWRKKKTDEWQTGVSFVSEGLEGGLIKGIQYIYGG